MTVIDIRERVALRRALDYLDSVGLCSCFVMPRRCPLRRAS